MKRRPLLVLVLTAAAAAAPATAHAQLPGQPAPKPVPPAPAPPVSGGKMSISVKSGLPTHRSHYVARGQRVLVVGRVTNFVAGQLARVRVVHKGKVLVR